MRISIILARHFYERHCEPTHYFMQEAWQSRAYKDILEMQFVGLPTE